MSSSRGLSAPLQRSDFDPYQKQMIRLLLEHEAVILASFMGSGKTGCGLYAACHLMRRREIERTLIVAPWAVARDTWPDEILTWDFSREFDFSVIMGTDEQRREALRVPARFHIINRENYKWLLKVVGLDRWPWDLLIYDEVTRLKGGKLRGPGANKEGKAHDGAGVSLPDEDPPEVSSGCGASPGRRQQRASSISGGRRTCSITEPGWDRVGRSLPNGGSTIIRTAISELRKILRRKKSSTGSRISSFCFQGRGLRGFAPADGA